jgi:hypothetical protein
MRPEDEKAFLLFHRELPGAQPWGPTCKQCNGSTTYKRHASFLGLCKQCEELQPAEQEEEPLTDTERIRLLEIQVERLIERVNRLALMAEGFKDFRFLKPERTALESE